MTTFRRFAFALTLIFFALLINAQAQTPSIEVSTDNEAAELSAQGETRHVRVEVFSPSGELVFETDDSDGQSIRWGRVNQKGERVADGVYLATITITDSVGKRRKRIEQITVSREPRQSAQAKSPNAVAATITGSGTPGTIAMFDAASNITDSQITESASSIGISTDTPTAKLHVNVSQPPASANNGTDAKALLQTSGGKGGNTTVGGDKTAGKGASISLLSGNGGNAVPGSVNGNGGNITLQPGSAGTGGAGGDAGNVLLAPSVGRVGIGTTPTFAKLQVNGRGSTTAVAGFVNNGTGVEGVSNTSSGVFGLSNTGAGVDGLSDSGDGVVGRSINGKAGRFIGGVVITKNLSFESQTRQMLNLYNTTYGIGVQLSTQYFRSNANFAWYRGGTHNDGSLNAGGGIRMMYLTPAGDLNVLGKVCATNMPCSSDARLKQNVTSLNYGLRQVLRLRPVSWHWKAEPRGTLQLGLVAQEVETVMPELVLREADASQPLGLNYMALLPVAVKAIQEQQQQIKQQAAQIDRQNRMIEQLQVQLNQVRCTIRRQRAAKRLSPAR